MGRRIASRQDPTRVGLTTTVGALEIDWPRSIGYFGAIGTALAFEVISWPVGLFIGAVPFLKMMNRARRRPVRFVGHLFDGAAKPVGGDAEGTIRIVEPPGKRAIAKTMRAVAGGGGRRRGTRRVAG